LPRFDERTNSPIPDELDALLIEAGNFLSVNDTIFNDSIRHTLVKDTLLGAFGTRGIGNLPLGVKPPEGSRNYLTWTGSDTVLGSDSVPPGPTTVVDRMLWMTETRVTYLVRNSTSNAIVAAVVRDYNRDTDILIKATVLYFPAASIIR